MWTLTKWFSASTGAEVDDMSAAGKSVTAWFRASEIGEFVAMTPVWTGTGAPVGALTLEQTNAPTPAVTDAADSIDLADYYSAGSPEPNPDGSAGRKPVLVPAAGASLRWAYTRTSGGTGATCTVYCADGVA